VGCFGIIPQRAEKLAVGIAEFETYIRNNQESIPNYGERYRQGETISTAFVESTINQFYKESARAGAKNGNVGGRPEASCWVLS
jgi:hypothetical protein